MQETASFAVGPGYDAPPIYRGDRFELRPGSRQSASSALHCGDPTDPGHLDDLFALLPERKRRKNPEPAVPSWAIIEPPNSRRGYDLLTYLAAIGVRHIIAWDADRYTDATAVYRRDGSWVTWDFSEEGGDLALSRMAFVYGEGAKRPVIVRHLEDDRPTYYNRRAIPEGLTTILLRGVPKHSPVLIAYDPSGNSTRACLALGLQTLVIEPQPDICRMIIDRL